MRFLFFTIMLFLSYSSFAEETFVQKFDKKVQIAVGEVVKGGKKVIRKMKEKTNSQTDEQVKAESKKKDFQKKNSKE